MVGVAMSFDIRISLRLGATDIRAEFASGAGLTALFGPSGAGKSSVLNMVAGLLTPDDGRIVVGGDIFFDRAAGINMPVQERRIGYVFQDGRLFPHMRVRDNLTYGQKDSATVQPLIALDEAVSFLGIAHLLGRWPRSLSGGEAQRVAIGRALLSAPRVLLMDEPLASLDAPRREEILVVIERLRDELKLPILYVSHDRAEVERLAATIINL
jgi:molybdate transport system ATP-binding protein